MTVGSYTVNTSPVQLGVTAPSVGTALGYEGKVTLVIQPVTAGRVASVGDSTLTDTTEGIYLAQYSSVTLDGVRPRDVWLVADGATIVNVVAYSKK